MLTCPLDLLKKRDSTAGEQAFLLCGPLSVLFNSCLATYGYLADCWVSTEWVLNEEIISQTLTFPSFCSKQLIYPADLPCISLVIMKLQRGLDSVFQIKS